METSSVVTGRTPARTDALIELKRGGVSDRVLAAMVGRQTP
jgi:hypothetical protein